MIHHDSPATMRYDSIICFVLISLTFTVYWQVYNYNFLNFDDVYITENPSIRSGFTANNVMQVFTSAQAGYWLPATCISHMLDFYFYGDNPGGHHLTNALFHLMNVLLLFFTFRRMTGAIWQSGFIAALFAIHPLHVESVAWVVERKDVLSAFFWLLTLRTYIFYTDCPRVHRYLLTLLFFILGLMSKPILVTLPFVLLLLDYWPLQRLMFRTTLLSDLKARFNCIFDPKGTSHYPQLFIAEVKLGSILLEKVPFFILSIIFSVITVIAQRSAGAINSLDVLPLQARLDNALVSYVAYLGKMVWPSHLGVLYPHPIMLPWWQVGGALILLSAISLLALRLIRKQPYVCIGWFWYIGVLLPVSGIMQSGVQAMADRFTYIPLIGVYILIAWGVPELLKRWRYKNIATPIAATFVLSVLVATSWFQVQRWRDSITLFDHTLKITSGNYLVHNHLGAALRDRGRVDEAIVNFNKAIQINPMYAVAYNNLGAILAEQGQTDEAIRYYHKSLQINPTFTSAHYNLALALTRKGQSELVIKQYTEVLRINPNNAKAHNNLGAILAGQGKMAKAALHFGEALRIDPEYAQAHHNMALLLYRKGEKKQAESYLQRSIQIERQTPVPK